MESAKTDHPEGRLKGGEAEALFWNGEGCLAALSSEGLLEIDG